MRSANGYCSQRRGDELDDTQRFAYGREFTIAFLRERGKAFETLFARIMAHAFPGDFQPVRPYGPKGDLKCDGFRSSDGTVFQCYAPDVMNLKPLLAKVDEDFAGALVHWTTKMRRWEFVHNDSRGLPAEAVKKLAELNTANPNVALTVCGEAELRLIAMSLALHQLEDLFGAVPSGRALEKLDFEALRPVLLAIQRQYPDVEASLLAPSAAKLERNDLSQDAAGLLRQGRRREQLVEAFFAGWPDPDLGEEIAQAFRVRYQALKAARLSPDDVFGELQAFAGGMTGEPARQGAVLAVLSYFFERCDIFEDAIRADAI